MHKRDFAGRLKEFRRAMRAKPIVSLLAAMLAATCVAACGSSSSSSSGTATKAAASSGTATKASATPKTTCPVDYFMETNITGADAQAGIAADAAMKYEQKKLNAAGGVLGCPVATTYADTGSDPTQDVPVLLKALSEHHFAAMSADTATSIETGPLTTQKKLISFQGISFAPGEQQKYSYLFAFLSPFANPAEAAIKYAYTKGYKKVAVIVDNSTDGANSLSGVQAGVHASPGMSITSVQRIPYTTVNATAAITAARATNPDVLFIDLYGTVVGHVLSDLQASGWKVPTVGGQLTGVTNIPALVPKSDYQKLVVVVPKVGTYPATPGAQQLIDGLKAAGATISTNLYAYSVVAGALATWSWAANKAGSLDSDKVKAALETTGNAGVTVPGWLEGPTPGYTASSHVPQETYAVAQMGALVDGQLKRISDVPAGG